MPGSIFVSYSHQDLALVKPVVGLLRATKDLVFQDLDSITPGGKWRQQIEEAVHAARLVVVFWCHYSSRSTEVRKEYKLALVTGKDVLPVLLDMTPLPEELNEFQWVDFRRLVGSGHRSYGRWIALATVSMFILLIISSVLHFLLSFWSSSEGLSSSVFVTAILVPTVWALMVWIVQRARRRRAAAPPTNYQQLMAEKSRIELFRRGIGLE